MAQLLKVMLDLIQTSLGEGFYEKSGQFKI